MGQATKALKEAYAESFVQVVLEQKIAEVVQTDIEQLLVVFKETNLSQYLSNKGLDSSKKQQLLQLLGKKQRQPVQNLLAVIKKNERFTELEAILQLILTKLERSCNRHRLTITVASALTEEQRIALRQIAEKRFDLKISQVEEIKDPSLLGGFILEANHYRLDTSLRTQLNALKQKLK